MYAGILNFGDDDQFAAGFLCGLDEVRHIRLQRRSEENNGGSKGARRLRQASSIGTLGHNANVFLKGKSFRNPGPKDGLIIRKNYFFHRGSASHKNPFPQFAAVLL